MAKISLFLEIWLVFFLFCERLPAADNISPERFEFEQIQMGVPVRLILYDVCEEHAQAAANSAFERFETLNTVMSDYDSDSELSQLSQKSTELINNKKTPSWIQLSDDLFTVLKESRFYCEQSHGAFDITVGPMVRLWRRSKRQKRLPEQRYLEQAKHLVGNERWELDDSTKSVRLLNSGMKLDLGGIAKGYAIDQAYEAIKKRGVTVFLIDAGGDIRAADAPEGGWTVSLKDGKSEKGEFVSLRYGALASSGDASRFVVIDGVRYSHLIDPKTGLGLTRRMIVHVLAPTATQADAWASALSVLGPEKGLPIIESQKNVSAKIIFCEDGQEFQSRHWISP